jgi:WD40 repeat protein
MPQLIAKGLPKARLLSQMVLSESSADMGWSSCGSWLAAVTTSGVVHLVDGETGAQHTEWLAHKNGALALCWHPRLPLLASSGQDGHLRLWHVAPDHSCALLIDIPLTEDPANNWIEHLSWRPDGAQLAAACGKKIHLLALDGTREGEYTFPGGTVGALCWRPKGAQLAAAGYGGIRVYNVLDRNSRPQALKWKGSLLSLNWSPDAQVIAAGCQDNSVHFWRLPKLSDAMMSGFTYKPVQLNWSKNSRWLLTGGSSQLILWSFDKKGPEGKPPVTVDFHQEAICAIDFANSGQMLATGCRAGKIAFWNQVGDSTPALEAQLDSRVEQLAWSPRKNVKRLASTSRHGTLSLWEAIAE